MVFKCEQFWQEVSLESLILMWPLCPADLFFRFKLLDQKRDLWIYLQNHFAKLVHNQYIFMTCMENILWKEIKLNSFLLKFLSYLCLSFMDKILRSFHICIKMNKNCNCSFFYYTNVKTMKNVQSKNNHTENRNTNDLWSNSLFWISQFWTSFKDWPFVVEYGYCQ